MAEYTGVWRRCRPTCSPNCRRHKFRWSAEVGSDPATGKRLQLSGTADTAKEAAEARAEAIKQHRTEGAPVGDRGTPFYTFLTAWIDQQEKDQAIRPTTAATYRRHARLYVEPTAVGGKKLAKVTAHDVETIVRAVPELAARRDAEVAAERAKKRTEREAAQAVKRSARNAERAARGLAPLPERQPKAPRPPTEPKDRKRTAGAVYAMLSSALGYAERKKLIPRNPCFAVEYRGAKSRRRADITWSMDQLRAFCTAALGDRLGELYVFAALTGLRRGELCALRWSDVDLGAARLVVRRNRYVIDWQVGEGDAKSEAGDGRTVALDTTSGDLLRALRTRQAERQLALGEAWKASGRVFVREDGSEWHPQTVSKMFTKFLAGLDLPRTTLHGLRHLSAMLGAEAGETLIQTSRRLGHAKTSTTADLYGHVFDDTAKRVADQRAALLQLVQ